MNKNLHRLLRDRDRRSFDRDELFDFERESDLDRDRERERLSERARPLPDRLLSERLRCLNK